MDETGVLTRGMRERTWELGENWGQHASGLFMPPTAPRRSRPVALDLFCGAGGFSLGLIAAGFDVIAGVDYSPDCMMTYLHNLGAYPVNLVFIEPEDRDRAEKALRDEYRRSGWCGTGLDWAKGKNGLVDEIGFGPLLSGGNRNRAAPEFTGVQHFFLGDVRKLTAERILREIGMARGELDAVVGGPPCQGFSSAGKQDVLDPRNSLVFEFMRLVVDLNPKTMVMEEVPAILNMVTPEGLPVVDAALQILSEGGFGTYDTLKRSLLATSGAGAVMRGKAAQTAKQPKRSTPAVEAESEVAQQSLWEAVAS